MKGLRLDNEYIAAGAFDFDGNILKTKTPQYFINTNTGNIEEFPGWYVDENSDKFFGESSNYAFVEESKELSFRNYRCVGSHSERGFDGLYQDVEEALSDNGFAPSFSAFKNVFFVKGRIWSLITARGNSPDSFERVFRLLRDELLDESEKEEQLEAIRKNFNLSNGISDKDVLQYYFKEVIDYICCDNSQTKKFLGLKALSGPERKVQAMDWWIGDIQSRFRDIIEQGNDRWAIGFSDDGVGNIIALNRYFSKKVGNAAGNIKARTFYTGSAGNLLNLQGEDFGSNINTLPEHGITREFRFG